MIPELAYEACRSAIHVKSHHRVIRLDFIPSYGFLDRARPGTLYRVGLAVSDILWQQVGRKGMPLLVVDAIDEKAYCVVGVEIPLGQDLPLGKSVT